MEEGVPPQEDRAGAAESSELVSVSQAGEHSTEEWVPLCDLGQSPASCLSRPGLLITARNGQRWRVRK